VGGGGSGRQGEGKGEGGREGEEEREDAASFELAWQVYFDTTQGGFNTCRGSITAVFSPTRIHACAHFGGEFESLRMREFSLQFLDNQPENCRTGFIQESGFNTCRGCMDIEVNLIKSQCPN
jgi:hypothetical protein